MRLRLVPTHCDSCSRSRLTQSNLLVAGVMTCPACGATARSMAGSSYTAEDLPVFDEVLLALGQAEVEPTQAAKWLVELNDGTGSAPGAVLRRLARALPSLEAVANGFGGQAKALRKADGLLRFLLEGLARSGRPGSVKYSRRAAPVHGGASRRHRHVEGWGRLARVDSERHRRR
jgi:hypothetical protein